MYLSTLILPEGVHQQESSMQRPDCLLVLRQRQPNHQAAHLINEQLALRTSSASPMPGQFCDAQGSTSA